MRKALRLAGLGSAVLLQTLIAVHTGPAEIGQLRVAMSGKYMPLHEVDSGQATGFEADLARALAQAMGRQVRFLDRQQMKAGALSAVASNTADVALNAVTPTPERAARVDFTRPIAMLEYKAASRTRDPETGFAVACPRSIAVADGPAASALSDAKLPQKTVMVKTTRAGIDLLNKGEVDCVVGEEIDLFLALEGTQLTVLDEAVGQSPIAMAVPKGQGQAYSQVLNKIEAQLKDLRRQWQIRTPSPGLEYPRIAVASRAPSVKPSARYVVVKNTSGTAAAQEKSPVLETFEVGTILDAPGIAGKADRRLEIRYAGRQMWINADDAVPLAGPFFSLTRFAPRADPETPCVDTACGCIVYQPTPQNTVARSPWGTRLLNGEFADQALEHTSVDARRRLAGTVIKAVLADSALNQALGKWASDKRSIQECEQRCPENGEVDACCGCGEEEEYTGLSEAEASVKDFALAFIDNDPDIEVQRRAKMHLCAFLESYSVPEVHDNHDRLAELCGAKRK
jgi:ABC-type amino acid transport substrate-binding protein